MSNFANLSTARISSPDTTATFHVKTVLISVMKDGGDIEYAIAPLKPSYLEAVSTAFKVLKIHLGNLTLDDISLKMGAKDISGELIWAAVAPSLWKEIVSESIELRIFPKSTSSVPMQAGEPFATKYKEPRPLITLKLPQCSAKDGCPLYMTIIAPKSYDEARTLAFNVLKDRFKDTKTSSKDVILRGLIDEGMEGKGLSFQTIISAYGTGESPEWVHLITQMKKEHPNFNILLF